ncbi:MAG: divergent polysaccharide deacetylase family protein [Sulfuricurvum sp.]|uniref:divergent polysaccharide deacetylase family protein n=1 Tax=Sulfuricurvum sp. TaxID=2025608 RepID=UPI0026313C17|nr:divergent polysaccharide deacetylase family protein [Sulfuricurvum sp.]MDD2367761.1 divergent polysaccharide deacetylase family protein [Sulfuricurvum sp.]MDD2949559.1 divergent polysaccharide deacetylase family protein [Sulfuricurvum sp.]MDD5117325.1 divergent polysaccharide deacetylase family protein [Sulfuricurvum sp.]
MSKRPRSSKSPFLKWFTLSVSVLLLTIAASLVGYFIGFHQVQDELISERKQTQKLIEQLRELAAIDESNLTSVRSKDTTNENEIRRLKKELEALLKRERAHEEVKPQHEYAPNDKKASPPPPEERPLRPAGSEAKLVIIMDDVSYAHDVKAIQSTGLPLVMSFLPPSSRHPDSALLAKQQRMYMVHLPLEAVAFNEVEPNTLHVDSSEDEIEKRLTILKQLYPHAHYMNNHTGSKFTSDPEAMDRLIRVMQKEGLQFVDSRTIATTKGREAAAKYGMRYLVRDVFLDDQDGVENVKKQIKKAVEKAKLYGTAIAIGHPRVDTIEALKESKDILKEVKLVSIEQI